MLQEADNIQSYTLSLKKGQRFVKTWHYQNRNTSSDLDNLSRSYLTGSQTTVSRRKISKTTIFKLIPKRRLSVCRSNDAIRFVNAGTLINKKSFVLSKKLNKTLINLGRFPLNFLVNYDYRVFKSSLEAGNVLR